MKILTEWLRTYLPVLDVDDAQLAEWVPLAHVRQVAAGGIIAEQGEGPAGLEAAAFAPLLAVYTAVLLGDTSTPTWNAAHEELPFVFASSASLAASGLAMVTTPVAETAPMPRAPGSAHTRSGYWIRRPIARS